MKCCPFILKPAWREEGDEDGSIIVGKWKQKDHDLCGWLLRRNFQRQILPCNPWDVQLSESVAVPAKNGDDSGRNTGTTIIHQSEHSLPCFPPMTMQSIPPASGKEHWQLLNWRYCSGSTPAGREFSIGRTGMRSKASAACWNLYAWWTAHFGR